VEVERAPQSAVLALVDVRAPHFAAELESMPPTRPDQVVGELEERAVRGRSAQVVSQRLAARPAKTRHADDRQAATELVLRRDVRQTDRGWINRRPARNRIALAVEAEAEFIGQIAAEMTRVRERERLAALRVGERERGQRSRNEEDVEGKE